jgi:hypothetical protein
MLTIFVIYNEQVPVISELRKGGLFVWKVFRFCPAS